MIGLLLWEEEEEENALETFTFHAIQEAWHASKLSRHAKLQLL